MSPTVNQSKDSFKIHIPDGPPRESHLDRLWKSFVIVLIIFLALLIAGLFFDFPNFRIVNSARSIWKALGGLVVGGIIWWSWWLAFDFFQAGEQTASRLNRGWIRILLGVAVVILIVLAGNFLFSLYR